MRREPGFLADVIAGGASRPVPARRRCRWALVGGGRRRTPRVRGRRSGPGGPRPGDLVQRVGSPRDRAQDNGAGSGLRGFGHPFSRERGRDHRDAARNGRAPHARWNAPWMDPERELRLWPHEHSDIYRAFDRIFGCRGHGWANLQSTHLNLPFRGDDEFVLLHDAVRLVLPLVPALAAASPVIDGRQGPSTTGCWRTDPRDRLPGVRARRPRGRCSRSRGVARLGGA